MPFCIYNLRNNSKDYSIHSFCSFSTVYLLLDNRFYFPTCNRSFILYTEKNFFNENEKIEKKNDETSHYTSTNFKIYILPYEQLCKTSTYITSDNTDYRHHPLSQHLCYFDKMKPKNYYFYEHIKMGL